MTSAAGDLCRLDAVGAAELIASGDVTPLEMVDAAIEQIEAVNPTVNAVVATRFEKARMEALDRRDGRFRGVPIVAKDYRFEVQGEATGYGLSALNDRTVEFPTTTFVASQLHHAGFVVVGRTNTPELATSITTEPLSHGPTRNPWSLEHSAGGSSGGSAAAVASLMAPVGIGTDGGGSLRIPASACGLVGLKPSRGRVSLGPGAAEYWGGASTDGAVTRTVRDAAAVLDCLRQMYPGDPYVAPPPGIPFEDEVGRDPGRLRIGVLDVDEDVMVALAPSAREATAKTAALLASLGHDVSISSPRDYFADGFGERVGVIVATDIAVLVTRLEELRGKPILDTELEFRNAKYRRNGKEVAATSYVEARSWLNAWARRVAGFWGSRDAGGMGFDLFVTPTLSDLPPLVGATAGDPENGDAALAARLSPFASQANVLGTPAVSLPLHVDSSGVPVGVQFIAAYANEGLLLRLASQLESAFVPAFEQSKWSVG